MGSIAEVEHAGRYTKLFSVTSWEDQVRQEKRLTRNDLDLLDRIAGLTTEGRRSTPSTGLPLRQDDNPRRALPTLDLRLLEAKSRARGYGAAALGGSGFDHGFNHSSAHS